MLFELLLSNVTREVEVFQFRNVGNDLVSDVFGEDFKDFQTLVKMLFKGTEHPLLFLAVEVFDGQIDYVFRKFKEYRHGSY